MASKRSLTCGALLILVLGVILFVAALVVALFQTVPPIDFGIVLDCGSTHTTVYIYNWYGLKLKGTGIVEQFHACDVDDHGISDYANSNTRNAGPALRYCLEQAAEKIPSSKHSTTPIFLGATAGMRLIRLASPDKATEILASVRDELERSPFVFDEPEMQARIISGTEEGAFGWITLNYLLKNLVKRPEPTILQRLLNDWTPFKRIETEYTMMDAWEKAPGRTTVGALDLGGASTQISFIPDPSFAGSLPDNVSQPLKLYGSDYDVYSTSFLCYGKREAELSFKAVLLQSQNFADSITNPCAPKGHDMKIKKEELLRSPCAARYIPKANRELMGTEIRFQGTSSNALCAAQVKKLFKFKGDQCFHEDERCSFNGRFQPQLNGAFMAFAGYYYIPKFLTLLESKNHVALPEYMAAMKKFCAMPWEEVNQLNASYRKALPEYCFDSHYIRSILVDGYGFDESRWLNLTFTKKIEKADAGWTLGFMINASNRLKATNWAFLISVAPFLYAIMIVGVALIILSLVCLVVVRRRPDSSADKTTDSINDPKKRHEETALLDDSRPGTANNNVVNV